MLLPTEPLVLWRWSTGQIVYICLILRWHSVSEHGFQCPSFCVYCRTSSGNQVCLSHAAGELWISIAKCLTYKLKEKTETPEGRQQRKQDAAAVPDHHSKPLSYITAVRCYCQVSGRLSKVFVRGAALKRPACRDAWDFPLPLVAGYSRPGISWTYRHTIGMKSTVKRQGRLQHCFLSCIWLLATLLLTGAAIEPNNDATTGITTCSKLSTPFVYTHQVWFQLL